MLTRLTTILVLLLAAASAPAQDMGEEGASSPAGAYLVKAGDTLRISVWKEPDLQQDVLVRPDGGFSFPLVGDVSAKHKSPAMLREEIATRLEQYVPDPVVHVAVLQIQGNMVYVLGKVAQPGVFLMSSPTDVLQALARAGGTTPFADADDIRILRREEGDLTAIPFDYNQVQKGENLSQNILLQSGDVVLVP